MSDATPTPNAIKYQVSPPVTNEALNTLLMATGLQTRWADFGPVLARSLAYVCAFDGATLIGFVNLAWDGGIHAFLLDTSVHPDWQRRGIGRELVRQAVQAASARGIEWIHVDYEAHL